MNRFYTPFLFGALIVLADALSKVWVVHTIPLMTYYAPFPYGGIAIFQNFFGIEFSLVHATNKGAAWGILAHYQDPLMLFRMLLIGGTLVYLLFFNKNPRWNLPFSLIIAGALGNVVDFFLYGHVIDMLHFVFWGYDYPIFNLADSAIFIGIFWLFVLSWWEKQTQNMTSPSSNG